jgi:hypothetical protein
MRRAFFQNGATYGDILYWSRPAVWKLQITTPNSSTNYVWLQFNVKDGPWVLEIPAAEGAGIFGSLNDAWQVPVVDVGPAGEDRGKGGKYLILPPGFKGKVPAGYLPAPSATHNGYAALRAIPATQSDADVAKALTLVKKMRLYPLARAANPPAQRYIDVAGKPFEGIVVYDDSFYDSLAKMVNEEAVQPRDLAAMGLLRSIGIEKGKPFQPDAATRAVLKSAIAEAHAGFMAANTLVTPYWPGGQWGLPDSVGAKTGFTFQTGDLLDVDARANTFFFACAPPKKLGASTLYQVTARDGAGSPLDGGASYRLHVPPNVPAKQFWAVTVYDLAPAAFVRESPKTEVTSYQKLQQNPDGSVDVYFGPQAPAGKESNWVYTAQGKPWVTIFRFYGPEKPVLDKTWKLPDIEKIQ